MRAAIYARYSSDNQRHESITAQIRACTDYSEKKNYDIVKTYIDEALSARTDDRPEFQQMIEDAKCGLFDILICHKIDRFSRDRYDVAYYKRVLQRAGVKIEYVEHKLDGSPESIILESVLEGMAEYYSKNLAREVQKGMRENAHQGRHNGGIPALGYDTTKDGKYVVNEAEAAIVRHIFFRRAEGASYNTIIAELNDKGWRTKRGQPFGKNSLHEIFRNQKYIGIYQYGKALNTTLSGKRNNHQEPDENTIINIGAVPPIIEQSIWDAVQSRIERHAPGAGNARREYLLSGLIHCHCGAAMVGTSTSVRGQKYWYYKCNAWDRVTGKKGEHQRIRVDEAENAVLEDVQKRILGEKIRPQVIRSIIQAQLSLASTHAAEIEALDKIVKEAEQKIEKIMDAIQDGGINSKVAARRIDDLLDQQAAAQERIKEIGTITKKVYLTEESIDALLDHLFIKAKEKEPGAIRLLLNKMAVSVTLSPTEFRVKSVLAFDGAGEGT